MIECINCTCRWPDLETAIEDNVIDTATFQFLDDTEDIEDIAIMEIICCRCSGNKCCWENQ